MLIKSYFNYGYVNVILFLISNNKVAELNLVIPVTIMELLTGFFFFQQHSVSMNSMDLANIVSVIKSHYLLRLLSSLQLGKWINITY